MNQIEKCSNIANKLLDIMKSNNDTDQQIETRNGGVIIDENSYNLHMASFKFGKRAYPFNMIHGENEFINRVSVEYLKRPASCLSNKGNHDVQTLRDLVNRLSNKNVATDLITLIDYLDNEGFTVPVDTNPVLSTNKSLLHFRMQKGTDLDVNVTVEAFFE